MCIDKMQVFMNRMKNIEQNVIKNSRNKKLIDIFRKEW